MARYHVNQFSTFPYHITGRISNKSLFPVSLPDAWEIMSNHLFLAHHIYGLKIHSFVMMPNHFHLLASLSETSLPVAMKYFMESTSKEFNYRSGRLNQNWGSRHHRCEVKSMHYFTNCYKYVYQNPLRANLVKTVQDWPYSTLHGILGNASLVIPVEEDTLLFDSNSINLGTLDWLNTPINAENLQSMRSALNKRMFKLRKLSYGRQSPLEEQRI